jgi:hypothetical protein
MANDKKENSEGPTSSLTDASGDPSVRQLSLEKDVGSVWADSIPSGTQSNVVLTKKKSIFTFAEDDMTILHGEGKWGSMEGEITIFVRRPTNKPANFAVVATVSASKVQMNEVFQDASLVKELESQIVSPDLFCLN